MIAHNIFERKSSTRAVVKRMISEEPLDGTHKVSYRANQDWDFEGFTDSASIDVSLAMPPHRPKHQPEHHRSSMLLSSESGPITVKVCRHCLNRPFNLQILGSTSDVTIYIPSNFKGFISYAGTSKIHSSSGFVDQVLPNAYVNLPVPRSWQGDQITVATSGTITLRVWDVFTKTAEKREMWRKVFRVGERRTPSPTTPTWNWDFLLEDDEE